MSAARLSEEPLQGRCGFRRGWAADLTRPDQARGNGGALAAGGAHGDNARSRDTCQCSFWRCELSTEDKMGT